MKFAREFREALRCEGFPPRWVDSAIPYGQLKKCLKKVQRELQDLGLDPETLRQLLAAHATSAHGDSVPLVSYDLDGVTPDALRPRLTVFVHLREGEAVDASLTPATRAFLQKLSSDHLPANTSAGPLSSESASINSSRQSDDDSDQETLHDPGAHPDDVERVEVPLVFDAEFFDLLQSDVTSLDDLQSEEEKSLTKEISQLGEDMARVAQPHRTFHKSDLSRWREVFELYLDAEVFFATHETDHGSRSSAKAVKQLVWFQDEVESRQLVQKFKLPASRVAFSHFVQLNARLLQNLKFQEINKTAVTKILKKFDKRTSLAVSGAFPRAVHSKKFLAESVAKDLCAQVSSQVVSIVPRVADYACPICMTIAYQPVRLECDHVFCVRCMVKMQRQNKQSCPLCRKRVLMKADARNLDQKMTRYMEAYFNKETKEKQRAMDIERGIEAFGPGYKHHECAVM